MLRVQGLICLVSVTSYMVYLLLQAGLGARGSVKGQVCFVAGGFSKNHLPLKSLYRDSNTKKPLVDRGPKARWRLLN